VRTHTGVAGDTGTGVVVVVCAPLLGVNFSNLLAQSANALVQSVSPTQLHPTLPVNTTRSYTQLL